MQLFKRSESKNNIEGQPIERNIGKLASKGVFWLLIQTIGGRGVSLASQLFLAWLLDPNVFGVVGIVFAVSTLVLSFVNIGVDDLVIQRKGKFSVWSAVSFQISMCLGILGMIIVIIAGYLASAYYENPVIKYLCIINALSVPISYAQTIPNIIIRSRMDFRILSMSNLAELILVQTSSVIFALMGAGAYSFFVPIPIWAAAKLMLYWQIVGSDITLFGKLRTKQLRYIISSGLNVLGARLSINLISQGDYIILGVVSTEAEVGAYYFAFKLAAQPLYLLAGNLSSVLFPALVALKSEPERQAAAVVKSMRVLSYIIAPICALQIVLSGPLIFIVFRGRWSEAIPIIQILSVGLSFDAITWITGCVLSANKLYRFAFLLLASFVPLFGVLVVVGSSLGQSVGTALAVCGFYIIMAPINVLIVFRILNIRRRIFLNVFVKPVLFALVSFGLVAAIEGYIGDVLKIAFIISVGPLVYIVLIFIFERGMMVDIISKVFGSQINSIITSWSQLKKRR